MIPGENLELLARGAAVGAFLGLAVLSMRGGASPARLTGALFCTAGGAHVLTQIPQIEEAIGWAWTPVWALSVMGAGLFWVFALELFEDNAKLDVRRFGPALALLGIGGAAVLADAQTRRTFYLLHNIIGAGLIGHALSIVARGWRGDLVEARRRLRGPILAVASVYALAVIAVQIGELFEGSAHALSPLAAAALLALGLMSLAAFGRLDPDLFGAPISPAGTPAADAAPSAPLDGEDAKAAAALDRMMREERAYRDESITIAALALRLKQPEHRLRHLINQRLGHRNFSAFLNQWRLADAKAALGDPTQRDVSISTIALDAGFASLGPFNRAFKAETGLTPSEFRAVAFSGTS